jgi:hypothetical protein
LSGVPSFRGLAKAALPPYNALLIYFSLIQPSAVEQHLPALACFMEAWQGLLAHAASHALLAALYFIAGLGWAASWAAASSTGALIEALQTLTPWRTPSLLDLTADALGAALGIWLAWALTSRLERGFKGGLASRR